MAFHHHDFSNVLTDLRRRDVGDGGMEEEMEGWGGGIEEEGLRRRGRDGGGVGGGGGWNLDDG